MNKNQIIISADAKHFSKLKKLNCILEVHDVACPEDLQQALVKHGKNIFPNGDGCYGKGIADWKKMYREPNHFQAEILGSYIRYNELFGYCYKARRAYQTQGEVHPELVKFRALKALVGNKQ